MGKYWYPSIIIILLALLIYIDAAFIEPNRIVTTENTFNLFNSTDPIKIVLISDIHIGSQKEGHLEKVVLKINEENADIILIAGDSINSEKSELKLLKPLKNLRAKYGTYAVLGNHDYGEWGCPVLERSLELSNLLEKELGTFGITVLRNEHRIIKIGRKEFGLVGIDEVWVCKNDYKKAALRIETMPEIIVMHNQLAVDFDMLKENSLILSGHTHCGEVRIPIITDILFFGILKHSRFGVNVGGHYSFPDHNNLYVTCGITGGTTGFRFLTNPEISRIMVR